MFSTYAGSRTRVWKSDGGNGVEEDGGVMEAMESKKIETRRRCGRGRRNEEDGTARRVEREREARIGRCSPLSRRVI